MSAPVLVQIGAQAALVDEQAATRWRRLSPRFAHVYVENRCNLRCEHCYESEASHPGDVRVSLAEYDDIFDGLANIGVLVLTFSGGEPFLRRDFLDVVELARKKRFAVRIYTSGTLLDEKKADRLRELKVSEVHISLYSHDADVHDGFTGIPGSHARSVRAVRLLRERGIKVVLKANIMRLNVDHLDELVSLARDVDAPLKLSAEIKRKMDGDDSPQLHQVPPEELARKLLMRPDLHEAIYTPDEDEQCTGESHPKAGAVLCSAARGIVSVGADGHLYPCTVFPVSAGDAREHGVEQLWYGAPLFDRIRKTTFGEMRECPTCELKAGCHPCMANSYSENGDHRGCNSTSKTAATANEIFSRRRRAAERRMTKGRALPLLGERSAERPRDPYVVLDGGEALL